MRDWKGHGAVPTVPVMTIQSYDRTGGSTSRYIYIYIYIYKWLQIVGYLLGRCGHKVGLGPNMGRFCPSCARILYLLRKYTEFHVKRTECQIIFFHLLLLILS